MSNLLSVGLDRELMISRTYVLKSAGYDVIEALTIADAWHKLRKIEFDLVILCHTVPREERRRMAMEAKARKPRVPILALHAGPDYMSEADACIDNLSGPQALLEWIKILIHKEDSVIPAE